MYNGRSPISRPGGHISNNSSDEQFTGQPNRFTYDERPPVSPYGQRSPLSPYDQRSPISPYEQRSPISPYDQRSPISPYDKRFSTSPHQGRSLSSSSNGSAASLGLSCIQAQLSPSSQLPRVSEYQLKNLEANFKDNRNPSDLDITLISAEVGLSESEVKVRLAGIIIIDQRRGWGQLV
ncbi:homeodomain-only protein [Plakobranchus ocellatus]|uniref:Homeodomain-only protein n=1 Tax=Plakobranchus ocellatus TaxID=259542 RepID=A0AAV4AZB7_9GAST|nr:homeodomain-only protein [Plakobranchus ocellatus]